VDKGKGWVSAADGMELDLNDKVRTSAESEASVVLYESAIISLDPGTEVSLADLDKEHLKVKQASGSTWNKFTGLLGVKSLSVETPNTVATVRGTSFEVNMDSVIVAEGSVEVKHGKEVLTVNADEKAVFEDVKDKVTGKMLRKLVKRKLSDDDRIKISRRLGNTVEVLRKIRQREINKKKFLVNKLKKKYNVSDEEIKRRMREVDEGKYDLDEMMKKSPIKIESLKKIRDLTEKIIKENKRLSELNKRIKSNQNKTKTTNSRLNRSNNGNNLLQKPVQRKIAPVN